MMIEGFEVENWTCIKRLAITDLPATGVIVLHGPNRRGKSSLVQALRACLMDYASSTTSLKGCYPRGNGEKPTVAVTFHVAGTTYRIKKCFGSSKSELASKTRAGGWRVEANTAAEAHSRVCELVGGKDSSKGLQQLLWLTQAEFRLPDPKKFDPGLQARLRGILGVLQTPLDDRFFERVKNRWNNWYSGQRKPGKDQKIKAGCKLADNLHQLEDVSAELQICETRFSEIEELLSQVSHLEATTADLRRQLHRQTQALDALRKERERSQGRIAARKLAEQHYEQATKELVAAREEQQRRVEARQRLLEAREPIGQARTRMESLAQIVQSAEWVQKQRRSTLGQARDQRRDIQERLVNTTASLRSLDDADKLAAAHDNLRRASTIAKEIEAITKWFADNPVPDPQLLEALKENRQRVLQLQADRDAASMALSIEVHEGSSPGQLVVDAASPQQTPPSQTYSVRRKAVLQIRDWGRIEVRRGTGGSDLDQIETDLHHNNEQFAQAMTSLGLPTNVPDPLSRLLQRVAEHGLKKEELARIVGQLRQFAPAGVEPLQRKVMELEARLTSTVVPAAATAEPHPRNRTDLEKLRENLTGESGELDRRIESLESEIEKEQSNLDRCQSELTRAKEELAGHEATVKSKEEELSRLRSEDQIERSLADGQRALEKTVSLLKESELTPEELTIDDRCVAGEEAAKALDRQIRECEEKYHRIRGRLEGSEGLHAQRASLSARVDELTRLTERETLEKDAVDLLYELFEECREKQLGALLGPIQDRVLNWMRILDIGDYKEVRFGDSFLPDTLVRRDGSGEFAIHEESTGAQEQIGMFVRLALGSVMTSPGEPGVAILDDPLTHCDVGRLNKMRAILRRAAEGDPKLTPPAGPLQIIVLTCHPEWFRDERATVIDLENPEVMERYSS